MQKPEIIALTGETGNNNKLRKNTKVYTNTAIQHIESIPSNNFCFAFKIKNAWIKWK